MSEIPPVGNGFQRPFETLVSVTREQTELLARLVTLQEVGNRQLELHGSILGDARQMMAGAQGSREAAVEEVKQHIAMVMENSERWWRRTILILGILLIIGQIVGVAIDKWLGLFAK